MNKIKFLFLITIAIFLLSTSLIAEDNAINKIQIINTLVSAGIQENKTIAKIPLKEYQKSNFLTMYINLTKNHPDKEYISYKVLSDLFKKDAPNSALKLFHLTKLNPQGRILLLEDLFVNNYNKPYLVKAVSTIIKNISDGAINNFNAFKIPYAYETYVFNSNCPSINNKESAPVLDAMDLIIKELCRSDNYQFPYSCLQQSPLTGNTDSILEYWANSYAESFYYSPTAYEKYLQCDAYLELPRRLVRYWKPGHYDKKVQEIIAQTNSPSKIKNIFWLK